MSLSRWSLVVVLAVGGCTGLSSEPSNLMSGHSDGAAEADAAAAVDLGVVDPTVHDAAVGDLRDSAVRELRDLLAPSDLAEASDLSTPAPDLSAPPDALAIGCSRELLVNGDFDDSYFDESGYPNPDPWKIDSALLQVIYWAPIEGINADFQPYSSPYVLKLGGTYYADGSVVQYFRVPAEAVRLRFSGRFVVNGYPMPSWSDQLRVTIADSLGRDAQTLLTLTSADFDSQWQAFSASLPAASYADNPARLLIEVTFADGSLGTDFLVDDLSLIADLPPSACN